MSSTALGSTSLEGPKRETITRSGSNIEIVAHYFATWSSAEANLKTAGILKTSGWPSNAAHATYTTAKIKEVEMRRNESGKRAIIRVIYRNDDHPKNTAAETEGTVVYESDSAAINVPIEQHPNFDGTADEPSVNSNAKPGVKHYLMPAPVWRRTENFSEADFALTEANIISDVGKISTPTGLASPTADAWLKSARRVRSTAALRGVVDEWLYTSASGGWDSDIYS